MDFYDLEYMYQVQQQPGIKGKLVLFYHDEEKLTPYQMLVESSKKAGLDLYLKRTGQTDGALYEHSILIGDETIVSGFAENNKSAREILGAKALELLQETCFTVTVKKELVGQYVEKWHVENSDYSISYNLTIEEKIYKFLESYTNSHFTHKLIFHNDFSLAERKCIHETCNVLKLKSKSFSKNRKWQVAVSKKFSMWELVEKLIKNGHCSENYELKMPSGIKPQVANSQNTRTTLNDVNDRSADKQSRKRPIENQHRDTGTQSHDYSTTHHYLLQQQLDTSNLRLGLSDVYLLDRVKQQAGCRGGLVLFHNSLGGLTPYQMLVESAQRSHLHVHLKRTGETSETLAEFAIEIGDEAILKGFAENNKQARDCLGPKAWELLQQNCFTVMVKTHLKGRQVDRLEIDYINPRGEKNEDNFSGSKSMKMMKLMGWKGRGLGREQTHRQQPVQVKENLRHFGLSFGKENSLDVFQKKIIKYLEDYVLNSCTYNLVFSNQFSVDERKIIHEASLQLKLKSKSFGKSDSWQIVVSKKLSPWQLVEHLLATRDHNSNYHLIRPTNVMLYNYFYK